MQPFFNIFGKNISSYAIMIFVAFIVCGSVFHLLTKKSILPLDKFLLAVYIFIGGIVGAKLLAMLVSLKLFTSLGNFNFMLWVLNSGLVFYGGVIGGFLMGSLYIKLHGLSPKIVWKNVCIVLPLGSAIGRIGCFLNGCCYGQPTNSFLGVIFDNSPLLEIHGVKVHPTQLYEMVACTIIFIILLIVNKKEHNDYLVVFLYTVLYGTARFMIEFIRGDEQRGILLFISISQIISLVIIMFGALLYFSKLKNTYLFRQTPPIIKHSEIKK